MDKKELNDISTGLRNVFQRANDALKKSNLEYALDLFKSIVKKEPGLIVAREHLREVEKRLTEKIGGFAKLTNSFKNMLKSPKIRSVIKKDPVQAMGMAEDMLAANLSDPLALNLLADAAQAAGADFAAVEAYELFRNYAPKNEKNLRNLAEVYKRLGEGSKVLAIFQKISEMHPGNLGVQQELRAAGALASIEKGHWEEEGDFHGKMKDQKDSEQYEKEDRIARAEDDIADMITRYEKALAEGDENIETWRKLADYYFRANRFDDCIRANEKIIEKMGVRDPLVDRNIERAMVSKMDGRIAELKAAGSDTAELEQEKYNYRLERAVDRVNNFANDTRLRYDLAVIYWEGEFIDEALQQFQFAQRNPQNRLSSIVYMGRCFQQKGQLDLAVEQIEKAVSEMRAMDKAKMEALYYLGLVYEEQGVKEKAGECFKLIYQANINFKDVGERIKAIYG